MVVFCVFPTRSIANFFINFYL